MEKEEVVGNQVRVRGDLGKNVFFFLLEPYALLTSVFICAYG